jgi:UDP-N-acetylmuramoyl-L-alanyl-D-glutamate--2,6-diaminopimelate ligase
VINLRELVADIKVDNVVGNLDVAISGVQYDSRKVTPGSLFVAIPGTQTDGHLYLDQAAANGAAAVLIERPVPVPEGITAVRTDNTRRGLALTSARFYGYPTDRLLVVGVTGTNGKTTTTHLIEAVCREAGLLTGLIGTIQNRIGERTVSAIRTTPESRDLQELLAEMTAAGVQVVSMEVSSHALELERVTGCEYDIAVFTNLTQDHLDFHPDMQAYLDAKARLFTGLHDGRKSARNVKTAVINIDDPWGPEIASRTAARILTYGLDRKAAVAATDIRLDPEGARFSVVHGQMVTGLELHLTGMFSVYNSLAAFAVGLALDLAPETIKKALESVKGVPGRFEAVKAGQPFGVIVDYAHSPDSLENVLKAAAEFARRRVIVVFGCGGDRDRSKRPLMGKVAVANSDLAFITSDNPRTEDPMAIINEITAGLTGVDPSRYRVVCDRRQAIAEALQAARPGDIVIIAGKGHEPYQIVGQEYLPFDDRQVAAEILKEIKK